MTGAEGTNPSPRRGEAGRGEISIIVPFLDEAAEMPALLQHLRALQDAGAEIVLVDGGSQDGSPQLARQAGFEVVVSAPGRARQMNAGAAQASGDLLLFLHADTRLPANAIDVLSAILSGNHPCWGRFDVNIIGNSRWFRVISFFMNLRSRVTGIATGDQALFVSRDLFRQAGGFPDQPLMEDIELSTCLRRWQPPVCLRAPVVTSGRRWEKRGIMPTIFIMWRLRWLYWLGASPEQLARQYR